MKTGNQVVANINIQWDDVVGQWVVSEFDSHERLVASMQVNYKNEARLLAAHSQRHWPNAKVQIKPRIAA